VRCCGNTSPRTTLIDDAYVSAGVDDASTTNAQHLNTGPINATSQRTEPEARGREGKRALLTKSCVPLKIFYFSNGEQRLLN
jgi:hypothetical protein